MNKLRKRGAVAFYRIIAFISTIDVAKSKFSVTAPSLAAPIEVLGILYSVFEHRCRQFLPRQEGRKEWNWRLHISEEKGSEIKLMI